MKPDFIMKKWQIKNCICEEGLKPCFMFTTYYAVDSFIEELSNRLHTDVIKETYLDYKVVCVESSKYMKAIKYGIDIILNNEYYQNAGVCPINFYNEKCYYDSVQIIEADVCRSNKGDLKPLMKWILKKWNKKLKNLLQTDVEMKISLGRIGFYIKRTPESYFLHDKLIDRIRMSNLIENSPFSQYALVNYYGEFIK